MKGRTMYVMPFSMGPLGSPIAHIGVELTDSPYVAANMRIMTRMGKGALDVLGETASSSPACTRSARRSPRQEDVPWPCNARTSTSSTSPRRANLVLRLRLRRQRPARQEVLRAAHRLGDGARRGLAGRAHADPRADLPEGEVKYIAGAFPSACGKTNLAMLIPTPRRLEGRDGRRRHRLDEVRRGRPPLRDQPRGRLLRRRPGHRPEDQPERDGPIARDTIFTNCALTDDGDIWWEGMTERAARAR